jgi:hypothetical protein
MYLKQTAKDVIMFGTDEHQHKLAKGFKQADIDAAAADLLAAYPAEAETIERYAARLKAMVK